MRYWRNVLALLAGLALLATACGGGGDAGADPGDPQAAEEQAEEQAEADGEEDGDPALLDEEEQVGVEAGTADLLGAGATFITPLMLEWIGANEPGIAINYQSIGSGGGIEQFLSESVDFGSTEAYLTDEEVADARDIRGCDPLHIPDAFGSVVVAYNDPDLEEALGGEDLVLDAAAIAGIFSTQITTWNDPAIAELNPGVELPDTPLVPVHRSDGSGTTYVFTTYLDDEDATWSEEVGAGTEVNWPAGTIGGNGNEGVTAGVQQQPGGVGYVSYAYAVENDIPVASVVNADGNPIAPTIESVAAGPNEILDTIPDDFRYDILGVGGEGYPIVGTHWVLAWECGYDEATAESLRRFFTWALTEGDALAEDLLYAPVSGELEERVLAQIDRINAAE